MSNYTSVRDYTPWSRSKFVPTLCYFKRKGFLVRLLFVSYLTFSRSVLPSSGSSYRYYHIRSYPLFPSLIPDWILILFSLSRFFINLSTYLSQTSKHTLDLLLYFPPQFLLRFQTPNLLLHPSTQ